MAISEAGKARLSGADRKEAERLEAAERILRIDLHVEREKNRGR